MTKEQISYMENSIMMYPSISKHPTWLRAFAEYNEDKYGDSIGAMLSVTCKPCYVKVLMYIKSKYK